MGPEEALSRLVDFMRWWRQELETLAPPRLRKIGLRRTLIVTPLDGDAYSLSQGHDGSTIGKGAPSALVSAIGKLSYSPRLILRLPARLVFVRTRKVPNSALGRVRSILRMDLAARTPFSEDDVSSAYDRPTAGADGEATVRHVIVRNDIINAMVAAWDEVGVHFNAVDAEGFEGLNLLSAERGRRAQPQFDVAAVAVLLAVIALVGAINIRQSREISALSRIRDGLDAETSSVRAAAARAREAAAVSDIVKSTRERNPSAISVLAKLTSILPDDVFLREFKLDGGSVKISGSASSASAVIGLIEGSGIAEGMAIEAPITPDAAGARENFRLAFSIKAPVSGAAMVPLQEKGQ